MQLHGTYDPTAQSEEQALPPACKILNLTPRSLMTANLGHVHGLLLHHLNGNLDLLLDVHVMVASFQTHVQQIVLP